MESANFLLAFSIATVAMLVLAGSIVVFVVFYQKRMIQEQLKRQSLEFEYQQKMMQAELESQESERRKLAADLHDSIGGMLSTIRVGITTMGRLLPEPGGLDETKQMLDDTITSVRRISRDLMPSTLEKFGLIYAVKELCERFQGTSRIQVQCLEQGDVSGMEPQRQLMIFRIVQELLNNAVKHAQATKITVQLSIDDEVHVSVEDDGVGFDAEQMKFDKQGSKGLGLFNIENRARLLGGALVFEKGRTKGTKTSLTLPRIHEKTT
jgi:two-component system, NarL family, sensor kinase